MEIYSIKRNGQHFEIIDQSLLPNTERTVLIENYQDMIDAIKKLKIRGAPAIGIAAVATAFLACRKLCNEKDFEKKMYNVVHEIEKSRPTAVNLFHATEKVKHILQNKSETWLNKIDDLVDRLMQYEFQACEKMAANALKIIPKDYYKFLTHCNTGSLATYGIGTALGVIRKISELDTAFRGNKKVEVFVDETRPLLQGSRLTAWELMKSKIDCTLITDNMAARVINNKGVQAIITGADRIACNGDTANKIGTFNLAILANFFSIPFYIVAPETTIDLSISSGKAMIIEERDSAEITMIKGVQIAPNNSKTYNPAFDITPGSLITAIITDKNIYQKPYSLG